MKFSEYIKINSYRAYLTYCTQNYLTPIIDVKFDTPDKLCWLVKPTLDQEPKIDYN
jgi:hypothetical protein